MLANRDGLSRNSGFYFEINFFKILLFRKKHDGGTTFRRKLPNQIAIMGLLRFPNSVGSGEIKVILALYLKQKALCPIHKVRLVLTGLWVVIGQITAMFFREYPLKEHDRVKIRLFLIAGGKCVQI